MKAPNMIMAMMSKSEKIELPAAFAKDIYRWLFLLLLVLLLLLPFIFHHTGLVTQKSRFAAISQVFANSPNNYQNLYKQVYLLDSPIDLLVIGSHITKPKQDIANETLKNSRNLVLNLTTNINAMDLLYIVIKELSLRRDIKGVQISLPLQSKEEDSQVSGYIVDSIMMWSELKGLAFGDRLQYFGQNVLNAPLLGFLSWCTPHEKEEQKYAYKFNGSVQNIGDNFPKSLVNSSTELNELQDFFLQKIIALCRQKNIPITVIN
ncbi:MAG: hypothetical protein HQL71_04705 [Magnetococcales bacterium]|nr:hypothetical protein [Magnetococcales bacterium]